MKRFIGFLITFMVFIFIAPVALLAQDPDPGTTGPLAEYFISFAAYIGFLLLVVEFMVGFIKREDLRKVLIWVVAVALGILAFVFKLGIFYTTWYVGLLYVIFGGAVGAGYLTTEQGQMLIDLLLNLFKSKATLKAEAEAREVALRAKNRAEFNT